MTALERAREYFDRLDEDPRVDNRVNVIAAIGAIINHLEEGGAPSAVGGMSRADALAAAREHVEAMSTNSRGFQDGVKLSDKVQAMDAFARFLMGENA